MAQQSAKPPSDDSRPLSDDVPYRSAIGSLMYMSDVPYDLHSTLDFLLVGSLSTVRTPLRCTETLIYRYIKGTQDMGLVYNAKYSSSSETSVIGYCDSDWAGFSDSRKSTEAYMFLLTGGKIS